MVIITKSKINCKHDYIRIEVPAKIEIEPSVFDGKLVEVTKLGYSELRCKHCNIKFDYQEY